MAGVGPSKPYVFEGPDSPAHPLFQGLRLRPAVIHVEVHPLVPPPIVPWVQPVVCSSKTGDPVHAAQVPYATDVPFFQTS